MGTITQQLHVRFLPSLLLTAAAGPTSLRHATCRTSTHTYTREIGSFSRGRGPPASRGARCQDGVAVETEGAYSLLYTGGPPKLTFP